MGVMDDDEYRCSVRAINPYTVHIEHGEDLPGSWYQQANGGRRFWTLVSGETPWLPHLPRPLDKDQGVTIVVDLGQ